MQAVVPVFWVGATVGIVLAITVIARVERLSRERYDAACAAGLAR
jgi:hypothetical protein